MTPPFAESGIAEVLARVIFRYAQMRYRRYPTHCANLRNALAPWALLPYENEQGFVALAIASSLIFNSKGVRLSEWKDEVVRASRCGFTVRQCLYPDYK